MRTKRLLNSLLAVTLPLTMGLAPVAAFAQAMPPSAPPIAMPAPTTIGPATGGSALTTPKAVAPSVAPSSTPGFGASTLTADPSLVTSTNTCGPDLQSVADAKAAAAAAAAQAAAQAQAAALANAGPAIAGNTPATADGGPGSVTATNPTTAAAAPPAPKVPQESNVAEKKCANDQVMVHIEGRPFEYHFGDTVNLIVAIKVADGADIDLAPLTKKKTMYMVGDKQWEVAGDVLVKMKKDDDGTKEYLVIVPVRQFLPGRSAMFYMQIPYTTSKGANGQPIWQVLQTPDYLVMQDAAGEEGMAQPDSGNFDMAKPRDSWAMVPLAVLVVLLLMAWPTITTVRYVNRTHPRTSMPRRSQAWLALERVRLSGSDMGYSDKHYGRISQILRKYLAAERPDLNSMPASSIEGAYKGDSVMAKVASVLGKIERVLVGKGGISPSEHKSLLAELDEIIPRPKDL